MIANAPRNDAGFTVVELLVSLVILALVMSFLPGTLRIGQRVWESDAAFSRHEAMASFRRVAEDRLTETMPVFARNRALGLRLDFSGEPNKVAFIAPAPTGPAGGGVYRFELMGDDGPGLVLRQTLFRQDSETRAAAALPAVSHVAPARIGGVSFRYFGRAEAGAAAQWQTRWTRPDALPDLVEMSLADGNGQVSRSIVELRLRPAP